MPLVRASTKGQVVIPAHIRKRYGIKGGTYLDVSDTGQSIVLRPLSDDPIKATRGMFAHLGPLTPGLLEERQKECEAEERELPPPGETDR